MESIPNPGQGSAPSRTVVTAARARSVVVDALGDYTLDARPDPALALGPGNLNEGRIRAGIRVLTGIL